MSLRRLGLGFAALAMAAGVVATAAPTAGAASQVSSVRHWGADRYETATQIAAAFGYQLGRFDTVIVASGEEFDYALAATPLAAQLSAPLLLTPPDELNSATSDFITENRVQRVIIVGGTDSVSSEVETALGGLTGNAPRRLASDDRFSTVTRIAGEIEAGRIGTFCGDGRRTALLATGATFADALALSPLAYAGPHPVLLTPKDKLPTSVISYLRDNGIAQVVIAGGTAAVADAVNSELIDLGLNVVRIWGQTRFDTAAEIARTLTNRCFDSDEFGLADGWKFPDALVGGTLLGHSRAPLLLAESPLPPATSGFFSGPAPDDGTVRLTVLGGPAAVAETVANAAEAALRGQTTGRNCDPRTDTAGVPRNVVVTPGDGVLRVTWNAPATVGRDGPSGYEVRYRPAGGGWSTVTGATSGTELRELTNGTLYEVQVRATGEGYGAWSPRAWATPTGARAARESARFGAAGFVVRAVDADPCPPTPANA